MTRPRVEYSEDTTNDVLRLTFTIRFTAEQFRAVSKDKIAALMSAVSALTNASQAAMPEKEAK